MAKNTFRGKSRFILKLGQLRTEVVDEIAKAQEANAVEFAGMVTRAAPVRKGPSGGALRDSTRIERPVKNRGAMRYRVTSGDEKAYYARWVEFIYQAYFYPSYRALRRKFTRRYQIAFAKARKRIMR